MLLQTNRHNWTHGWQTANKTGGEYMEVFRNHVIEWSIETGKVYSNPFKDVQVDVRITGSDEKEMTIPGFWRRDGRWSFRFSSEITGEYTWETICTDHSNHELHGVTGSISVREPDSPDNNILYRYGRLKISENKHYFQFSDGTPFFILADNWVFCLAKRLHFTELEELINDRIEKGYSSVMINVGQNHDIMPFDDRAEGDGGFPWEEDFKAIRPEFYDEADKRIFRIIDGGLLPYIIGTGASLIQFVDEDMVKLHWRYVVARYGAYPVLWCAANETCTMLHGDFRWTIEENAPYREILLSQDKRDAYGDIARRVWGDVSRYIKEIDPYQIPLSIMPSVYGYPYPVFGRESIVDDSVLDFEQIKDYGAHVNLDNLNKALCQTPSMPVVANFVCDPKIDKELFWTYALNGVSGVIHWSLGIFYMNTEREIFGPSGHGCTWTFETYKDGMNAPVCRQLGKCREILEQYEWQHFEPHPEWIVSPKPEEDQRTQFGLGISRIIAGGLEKGVRIFYIPSYLTREMTFATKPRLKIGKKPVRVKLIELNTMHELDYGVAFPDKNGEWIMHKSGYFYQPIASDCILLIDPNESVGEIETMYSPEDAIEVPWENYKELWEVESGNRVFWKS
jgi:hypothetical protein